MRLLHSNSMHIGATFLVSLPQLNARFWIGRSKFTMSEYIYIQKICLTNNIIQNYL